MNKRRLPIILFALLCAVQLAFPLATIVQYERTLAHGELLRFKTQPVDPYDAMRGRYVLLRIEEERVAVEESERYRPGMSVYAVIVQGADGFSKIGELVEERPLTGVYMKARVNHVQEGQVLLSLPFEHLFMNESLAPEAERLYREANRGEQADAYVGVRVLNGRAVLEELYLKGLPIGEYIERYREQD